MLRYASLIAKFTSEKLLTDGWDGAAMNYR